jgi:hypothetical protein
MLSWRALQRAAVSFSSPANVWTICRLKIGSSTINRAPRLSNEMFYLRSAGKLSDIGLEAHPPHICEYAVGVRIKLVTFDTMLSNENRAVLDSFFHSASFRNAFHFSARSPILAKPSIYVKFGWFGPISVSP